jgi:hypothetical protein
VLVTFRFLVCYLNAVILGITMQYHSKYYVIMVNICVQFVHSFILEERAVYTGNSCALLFLRCALCVPTLYRGMFSKTIYIYIKTPKRTKFFHDI